MSATRFKLVAALLCFLAFGQASAITPAKVFKFRLIGEPETLDWNRAHTPVETYVLMNLMEGLTTFDSDLKVQPALAESWKVSADGKTYLFKLRKGVKWSDGTALRAQDFAYSWKRLLDPATAAAYAYFLFDVEGAEGFNKGANKDFSKVGVKALDDSTLQVKLTRAIAHWIYIPTFWVTFPLREDIVQKHGTAWASPGKMVTVGPFTLESHEMDSKITLKPNPQYYGKGSALDLAIGLVVKDDSTALTLYQSHGLDFMTDIPALDLPRLQGRKDLKAFPYLKTGYMGIVVDQPGVEKAALRRAIAMAIDKSKLGEILHGGQQPATSFLPPKMLGHSPKAGLAFDVARAKAELKASGMDPSKPIEILLSTLDKPTTIAQYIQGELKKNLGLNVTLQPYDNKTFRAQLDLRKHPMFLNSWSADFPDPDNFLSLWLGSAGNNRTNFKNAKYDELVLKARGLQDRKAREKLYADAEKILLQEEAAVVPLYYEPNLALVQESVKGLELNPLNYLLLKKVSFGP